MISSKNLSYAMNGQNHSHMHKHTSVFYLRQRSCDAGIVIVCFHLNLIISSSNEFVEALKAKITLPKGVTGHEKVNGEVRSGL